MEAAALGPEVDCNGNHVNAALEVKKLQELVRELERQNERLRCRAAGGGCLTGPRGPFDYFLPHMAEDGAATSEEEEEEEEDGPEPSLLDELELLDLDSLCSSDESDETWLYVSSKAKGSSGDSLAALRWCRQSLDRSKSEVEAARQSLSLRLEQVSRWRSSLSRASSPGPPLCQVAGVSPVSASPSAKPCSTPQSSERHAPCLPSPLHHRTLSPVARELSPVAERTPTFLPHRRRRSLRCSAFTPPPSVDGDLGAPEAEDDPVAPGYKPHDLADVQVMARLQEESLRQDYASTSPALAGRRRHSFAFQLSRLSAGLDLEEDEEEEEDDEDYGLLPPPQPRLTRLPHSHTFSSMRDWRRSTSSLCTPPSTPSTPPYPFSGFTFQHQPLGLGEGLGLGSFCTTEPQGFRPESDKLRRSLPNLVRAPSMPCVPMPTKPSASPCLLRNSHSFDSSGGPSPLHSSIPSPGQPHNRVQSVGNFASLSRQPLKATAYVSPTIKGSSPSSAASSACLQALSGGVWGHCGAGSGIPLLSKAAGGGTPAAPTTPRSGLPRPASFVGSTSSTPRSKVAQSARSFLTPPKTLSTLSALRDGAWRDGCF